MVQRADPVRYQQHMPHQVRLASRQCAPSTIHITNSTTKHPIESAILGNVTHAPSNTYNSYHVTRVSKIPVPLQKQTVPGKLLTAAKPTGPTNSKQNVLCNVHAVKVGSKALLKTPKENAEGERRQTSSRAAGSLRGSTP